MKKILLSFVLLAIIIAGNAQNVQPILCQDFSNSTTGWLTGFGASITTYENGHNACAVEYGIVTPGVGGNNPAKILSEIVIPNQPLLEVKFNIGRYNSNLKCNSLSDFGCPTTVDIIAVASNYNGLDPIGDGATIYSNNQGFLLPISGGTVSLLINVPPALPAMRIFFNFRTSLSCIQGGTKYVMDKFCFTGYVPCQVANTCPPVANNDYFLSGSQGFANTTLQANVYGTNLAYTPVAPNTAFTTRSITHPAITPDGGNDFDIDNHPLSAMTFSLISQTFVSGGVDADFTFNADGTFSFFRRNLNKNQFFFTYRLTDPQGNFDDAVVRIDYSSGGPLPVSLVNFNAVKSGTGALLSWQTAQEQNNKGFDILRKTNGAFEKIGFVASKAPNGNSTSNLSYTFNDMNMPSDKTVYYRLVQVDIDGKQAYSDIRAISNGDPKKQPLLVYPNPSRGDLQVIIPADYTGLSDLEIYNPSGALIQGIRNTAAKRIDITGLRSGIYFVKVISLFDNTVYTKKLIVQ